MSNVTYAFVKDEQSPKLAFESKVSSFGVDHVTKKDLTSFYMNFSTKAYFDSGILPVDGSGILTIRTAGAHTQIGYQHKPGMYYINWGAYERDPNAAKIYVAQPYRIVIADIYNDNILGARTFYSPIPIQHPDTPLYHVNLPNINCRGYRGNGVGWICLYHTEDISSYPFSEKVAKILERCSGVEAYNDQNMSETDGPRFYRDHNKPNHTWIPSEWEKYSTDNGFEWTLDPDLWIPVLVKDADHQDRHDAEGKPLTYADAILGNYQAYYHDPIKPKLVNKIARQDLEITNEDIFNLFKTSYNSSVEFGNKVEKKNSIDSTIQVRESLSKVFVAPPSVNTFNEDDEDEDDNSVECQNCGEYMNPDSDEIYTSTVGATYCMDCSPDCLSWVEHLEQYVENNHPELVFSDVSEQYYLLSVWKQTVKCQNCSNVHVFDTENGVTEKMLPIWRSSDGSQEVCSNCFLPDGGSGKTECEVCTTSIPSYHEYYNVHKIVSHTTAYKEAFVCNSCYYGMSSPLERSCELTADKIVSCICGNCVEAGNFGGIESNIVGYHATINHVFGFDSNLGKVVISNPNIATNFEKYSEELQKSLANVTFSGIITTKLVCPECLLDAEMNGSDDYKNRYSSSVESNVIKLVQRDENVNNLFGTTITIFPTF